MKSRILSALLILLFITACNGTLDVGIEHPSSSTVTPVPAASDTPVSGNTVLPKLTLSAATATLVPTNTSAPVATDTAAANPTLANYIDDRSTPSQVIVSLYNAINRHEYLRAYNYWINPSTTLGSFSSYANGYKDTASVNLVFGQITGGAGAGQIYYTVPVILKTTTRDGTHANWAACYVVHQSQPANFGAPPFNPMGIDRGSANPSDLNASDPSMLATACSGFPTGGSNIAISVSSLNIDKRNFLDNRSGPIETVSSLLNALNLKQYVRAYYYFETPATFPGPYASYAAGYSATDVITVTFGIAQSEGAAGSLYFKVPLAIKVLTTSAVTQTFVGCYTLRLAQPSIQATPPFQPLAIKNGIFNQVANGTDVSTLLPTACN
jgi:hypothetical protein